MELAALFHRFVAFDSDQVLGAVRATRVRLCGSLCVDGVSTPAATHGLVHTYLFVLARARLHEGTRYSLLPSRGGQGCPLFLAI